MRILSPSLRNVPLTGLEWSFASWGQGFNEYGKKSIDSEATANTKAEQVELVELADHLISEYELSIPEGGGLSKYFDEEFN